MDSLIFELQIVFYFQLFLSANVRHSSWVKLNHLSRNRALVGKFEIDLVSVDSCSIFRGVFNDLISVYVFILSRGLNRRMLLVKRTVHYLILVSCIISTLLCLNRLE